MDSGHLQVARHGDVCVVRFRHPQLDAELPELVGPELYGMAAQEDCLKDTETEGLAAFAQK